MSKYFIDSPRRFAVPEGPRAGLPLVVEADGPVEAAAIASQMIMHAGAFAVTPVGVITFVSPDTGESYIADPLDTPFTGVPGGAEVLGTPRPDPGPQPQPPKGRPQSPQEAAADRVRLKASITDALYGVGESKGASEEARARLIAETEACVAELETRWDFSLPGLPTPTVTPSGARPETPAAKKPAARKRPARRKKPATRKPSPRAKAVARPQPAQTTNDRPPLTDAQREAAARLEADMAAIDREIPLDGGEA